MSVQCLCSAVEASSSARHWAHCGQQGFMRGLDWHAAVHAPYLDLD